MIRILPATVLLAALLVPLHAAPNPQVGPDRWVRNEGRDFDARARAAVDRGLAYLSSQQMPNGSWHDRVGYVLSGEMYGERDESVYATALACLALVAAGHVPGRGAYGWQVSRGIDWLLSKIRQDGYISHAGSRMYEHALATIFLTEMVGMTRRADLRLGVKRATYLIINSQNREGGWRHQPTPIDADLTVTALVIQALRAARNVGIAVPDETVQGAVKFVNRCATSRGFTYQPRGAYEAHDWRVTYAMTGCGIVSLYSLGRYDTAEVRLGIRALVERLRADSPGRLHYYFAHFFAAQAFYIAGGDPWAVYYPRVRDEILRMQATDGHWEDDVGINYATAMACIVLQMPCEYLSLFQK